MIATSTSRMGWDVAAHGSAVQLKLRLAGL